MGNPYRKLYCDEKTKQYSFRDFTYDKEKNHINIECINIIKQNERVQSLKFGYYSKYDFYTCPIWLGNILCHNLISEEKNFTFGFSYLSGELLSYYEINFSLNSERDNVLEYTFNLINFLNLISVRKEIFLLGYDFEIFKNRNFNDLPFNFSMTEIFTILQKAKVETKSDKRVSFQLEPQTQTINSFYIIKLISDILTNEIGLNNSGIKLDHQIEIYIESEERKQLDVNAIDKTLLTNYIKDVILFFFPIYFDRDEFLIENFTSKNISNELHKSFMEFGFLR